MNIYSNQPWSSYQPVGEPAESYELNPKIQRKPVASLNSLNSFTGISNTSYTGLVDRSQPPDIQRTPPGYQGLLRWWLPEILSSFFSIGSFIALIIVLRTFDGRGLDDLRLPSWLTVNGLVAIIATLNRVALVAPVEAAMSQEVWLWFSSAKQQSHVRSRLEDLEISDSASRGAWGSFIFLWKGSGRWLSYIGAVVVILSLAFGAFTQQLIGIVSLPVRAGDANDLAAGNIPNSQTWANSTGNPAEDGLSTILSMKAAVYNGFLEGGITPLHAFCPTGNCTFPITPTMAVCGECRNVSYTDSCNSTVCEFTMATGTVMHLANWFNGEATYGVGFQVVSRTVNPIGTRRLDIALFDILGGPYDSYTQGWPKSETLSSTCSMWMCVNALSVTTNSNSQTQTLNASFSKTARVLTEEIIYGNEGGYINFAELPAEMNPVPGANYSVEWLANIALTEFMAPMTNGSVILNLESHIPSSDTVEAVWNGTVAGLDVWVKNLALSMTNAIRTAAPVTVARYNGTAYQSGIRVRWVWLSLPAAMVLMSLFVLLVVVTETSRARVKAWKGSPLAYLATDLDGAIKQDVGSADVSSFKGVEKAIGRRRVVLDNQSSGRLIFREAHGS